MKLLNIVNWIMRTAFQLVCRIDKKTLRTLPKRGPYILVGNHINFLEAPVAFPYIDNPDLVGIAKRESWDNPLFNFLFNLWGIIPIDRGEVDREAFRRAESALNQGKILAVFPEGTRSKDGRLIQGKPGVVALAIRSKAPLVPIAFYGYENFWENLKRLRRTDFKVSFGRPFILDIAGEALSRDVRQAVTDEIMYKIAEQLPERYRGVYHFDEAVEYRYLRELQITESGEIVRQ